MCGIAGITCTAGGAIPDLAKRLLAMSGRMAHRGPNDDGIYLTLSGLTGLANRRLAIQDLTPAGHMPMANASGSVVITYNGELYNTAELRPELERLGYTFVSHSDTEAILHGYEAWGTAVLPRLRGIFGLAIVDMRPEAVEAGLPRVVLARDHLGVKPLYYAHLNGALIFASELKTLLASGLLSRTLSSAALVGYLLFGAVPNPWTMLEQVKSLPPGSLLTWRNGGLTVEGYWHPSLSAGESRPYAEVVSEVRELLSNAVRSQLVSDVPLGAFLSGGLDSSAVVALMRSATSGPIRTCSMVFEEAAFSEAPYARAMAAHIGAEHHERVVTVADLQSELDHIFASMDQPTVDGINSYFVSQTARQAGLTVALSGLGGDELFGGYPVFRGVPRAQAMVRLAQRVPGGASFAHFAVSHLPDGARFAKAADAFLRPASRASAYLTRRGLFAPSEVRRMVSPAMWESAVREFDAVGYVAAAFNGEGAVAEQTRRQFEWVSIAELRRYTHNQLLMDTDVMSMAHSLEVRVPLLDVRLVEAMLQLPTEQKTQGDGPKPLMAAAIGDLLPPIVRVRRGKQGFTFPFAPWLRGKLRQVLLDAVQSFGKQTFVNKSFGLAVVEKFEAGRVHWTRPWALAVAGRWLEAL